MFRRLSMILATVVVADSSSAEELSFSLGSAATTIGNHVATNSGPIGLIVGSVPGALARQSATGQPFEGALASQVGENLAAIGAGGIVEIAIPGGGVMGNVARAVVGKGAEEAGRHTFNEGINYQPDQSGGSIGGLQAKFDDLPSINGMKAGIQQYDLSDKTFNPADQSSQPPSSKTVPRYESGPLDPDDQLVGPASDGGPRNSGDQLIGRVPTRRDNGSNFGLPLSGGSCGGLDYTRRNPCEGF